jgi:neutral ceramidase
MAAITAMRCAAHAACARRAVPAAAYPAGRPRALAIMRAGLAKVCITPHEQVWLDGWAGRQVASQGITRDIFVKALALVADDDDAGAQQQQQRRAGGGDGDVHVWVSCELCGLSRSIVEDVAQWAEVTHSLSRRQLILHVTHNHSGPRLSRDRGYFTDISYPLSTDEWQKIDRYTVQLLVWIKEAVTAAIQDLAPACLRFSQGLAGLGTNRRRHSTYSRGSRARPTVVDQDVPCLQVLSDDGTERQLRGLVFGYACHPTCTNDHRIHGDYCGWAAHYIEESRPGCTVAMFVQGCGADINPLPRQKTDPRRTDLGAMYGKILHYATEDACVASDGIDLVGSIASTYDEVHLPFDEADMPRQAELEVQARQIGRPGRAAAYQLRALQQRGSLEQSVPFPAQVWHIGLPGDGSRSRSLTIIALTGECVSDYSLALKARYGWENVWVSAYNNELLSYVPSRRVLREGDMEGWTAMRDYGLPARYSECVEQQILTLCADLVQACQPNAQHARM